MSKLRLVILISGSGSNLQAILDAIAEGELTAVVTLVISNRKAAYGLVRAKNANVPTLYHPFKPYREASKSRDEYEADLAEQIKPYQPDLIVLAGWMHVLGGAFLRQFPHQIINLHPALPDAFPGTHAIERAYAAYQKGTITHSGCMIHYVVPEVDAGEVILEAIVPIMVDDTLDTFAERMHKTEHRIIVAAIRQLTQ
jgi:formyltetrahydrofolate-dependent phosphoribosylglycinamide formyltransferase